VIFVYPESGADSMAQSVRLSGWAVDLENNKDKNGNTQNPVAKGIACLRGQGILHGDLKAVNVLVNNRCLHCILYCIHQFHPAKAEDNTDDDAEQNEEVEINEEKGN
jgi:tRNA A-37 threonylcarbamoyl transferase component Bud32